MPVFIDEIVFRGEIRPAGTAPAAAGPAAAGDRDGLVAEVAQAVIDHLERALERSEER